MEEQADIMAATYDPVDEGTRQACAFKALAEKSRCLDHLHRYETRARRAFKQGIVVLEQLRALTAASVPASAPAPEPRRPEPVTIVPAPESKAEPQPEPKPAPEPTSAEPAPAAEQKAEPLPPAKPVHGVVRLRSMPKHLRREWNCLQKSIPNFDTYWHYERMSPGLQDWINKRAA